MMKSRTSNVTFLVMMLGASCMGMGLTTHVMAQDFTWFVDDHAMDDTGLGNSWDDPFKTLQRALEAAEETSEQSDLIKVAQGTYVPTEMTDPPDERSRTFLINFNFVTIEGGYAGIGAPDPNARDVDLYRSKLSGNIDPPADLNAYHVVKIEDVDISVRLDGLWIFGGVADGDPALNQHRGGGMLITGRPSVIRCIFTNNNAGVGGAETINRRFTLRRM